MNDTAGVAVASSITGIVIGTIGVYLLGNTWPGGLLALEVCLMVISLLMFVYIEGTTQSSYQIGHLFGDMLDTLATALAVLAIISGLVALGKVWGKSGPIRTVLAILVGLNVLEAGAEAALAVYG